MNHQRLVVREDRSLERAELGSGLNTQFVSQGRARPLVRAQRVGLAAAPVESEHEHRPATLTERLGGHHRLQLRDARPVSATCKIGVHQLLGRNPSQLGQPRRFGFRREVTGELLERRPAPQLQRLAQRRGGATRRAGDRRAASGSNELFEAPRVDGVGARDQSIAGRAGLDHLGAQHLAQAEHVVLEGLGGGARRVVAPERGHEPVGADHVTGPEDQRGEKRALPAATRREGSPVTLHLDGTEDPELHGARTLAKSPVVNPDETA